MAQVEARRLGHNYVGTEQLLIGLIATRPSIAAQVLADLDITLEEAQEQVQAMIGRGQGLSRIETPFTPRSRHVLEQSLREAQQLGQSQVAPEHLLLAIVQEEDTGLATQILERLGVERVEVRLKVLQTISEAEPILKGNRSDRKNTLILNECGVNLTELAALGRLDPVVGRTQEVERMIQILGRRTKNNPILIGEPGVGKTALAEGLAQRIIDRDVPESLQDQQVLTLNIGTLLAGTKYRGEFEERLKTIMKEVCSSGNIILVIDEVHTLLGAGSAQGSLDAANILKPALARGDLRCIGATTLNEYREYFEQDAALERRFQPVMIDEPSVEETILILQGLRSRYEQHHRLEFSDLALEAAAKLADRYISDRLLPDKAIDLIDEAGSRARILHDNKQFSLDKDFSERFKQLSLLKASAIAQQDFRYASEVRSSELALKAEVQESPFHSSIVVNEADIAHIVSAWTGVPVNKVTEAESEQLMQMEAVLHQRLIGQQEAVSAIARATRRARAGLSNPNRPIASFIFSGPTGVGKTELVKALAACFFGSESAMIRLDMSEFMERHTVSKLIGSPPGYVGYGEGGQLTEAVRRKPYTVVLFDEIEKAHPDVFNLLLQILEEGRLTDAKGRTVNFKNTLLVMTSNVGSNVIQKGGGGLGFEVFDNVLEASYRRTVTLVNEELKQYFRPEFLNRLDDIIVFRQLTHNEIKQIADLLLTEFSDRLLEQGIKLEASDRVKDRLIEAGYHPEQGVRPLRRAITRLLEDSLAENILSGRVKSGDSVRADLDEHGQIEIV